MMTAAELEKVKEQKFTETVTALRVNSFRNGLPFLILSESLPGGQSYYEFADGHIEVQEVYIQGAEITTRFVRNLTPAEADRIRQEHGFQ